MTFGADLYEAMSPLAASDAAEGYALRDYCDAIGSPFEWACTYALDGEDGTPGWSLLLSPWTCPAEGLAWLGQFVGVIVDATLDEQGQRTQIAQHQNFARGTPGAIITATQATLTGAQHVYLIERVGGDAWQLAIYTDPAQTPNPAATLAAAQAAAPAGVVVTHTLAAGQPYAVAGSGKTYAQWKTTYPTYTDLRLGP